MISRTPLSQSASFWAQGGLAAALEPGDSPARHAADTIAAGPRASAGPRRCRRWSRRRRARCASCASAASPSTSTPDGELALGLEGGHTRRRIVHAGGSQTGHEITAKLAAMVAAEPRIAVRERTSAVALWSDGERCHGLLTEAGPIAAAATVLATGGAAALWRRTTNPWGAIGAGPVLAAAAGADLADLEFCQFHPTALALPGQPLRRPADHRGGARRGRRPCSTPPGAASPTSWRRATRSPRRSSTGSRPTAARSVRLDLRELDPARFPNVFESLREAGLDPRAEPVPVAPAAHYTMGGIAVDLDGRSSLPGLFAVGECSCTGLHGANRLASNSLSECFVFGGRAAARGAGGAAGGRPPAAAASGASSRRPKRPATPSGGSPARCAGPSSCASCATTPTRSPPRSPTCALERPESRGGHLRTDFPGIDPELDGIHIVLGPDGETRREEWR